jgi:hypothetical protein
MIYPMGMTQIKFALITLCIASYSWGANRAHSNMIGVSQGVSAPSQTSTINYSRGFTAENPAGVIYQTQGRLTGQYDTSNERSGFGGELGIGNGQYGIAGGYYEPCDGCDSQTQGALGISVSQMAIGLRFGRNLSGAGLLFNPHGQHRFGFTAELSRPGGVDEQITSLAGGYSYFTNGFSFSLDASQRTFRTGLVDEDVIMVTPGIALYFNKLSFSLSYDRFINDTVAGFPKDHLWFGLGYGEAGSWYLNVYNDYYNRWSAALSFFF